MTGTYDIIPIGSGLIVAYLFSLAGIRLGIIRLRGHRRFWDVLLLLSFLTTAFIGILLAVQANYKLTLRAHDTWMQIHVDTGIAMAMIAIFHHTWHLWFYAAIFSRKKRPAKTPEVRKDIFREEVPAASVRPGITEILPVYALGFTSMTTQLVILRAFISVFQGNELVLGVILGNWMLLTGLGAWLGKSAPRLKNGKIFIFSNLLWLGTLPVLTVFLLFFLKNIVFIPGSLTGLFAIFLGSLVLLLPFCFLSGYSFSFYAYHISDKYRSNLAGRTYAWEAFGSLSGGFLFSFLLVFFLKSLQTLGVVLLVNIVIAFFLARRERRIHKKIPVLIFFSLFIIALFVFPVDRFSRHFLYRNQKILEQKETPFGSLVISKTGDQVNLYENHVLISNTLNTIENEEDAHYAMLQRSDPKEVLLISGGVSGIVREILKYPVRRIDYVEINPWIIRVAKKLTRDLDNKKVHIIIKDARRYVPLCKKNYDAILINLPPPLTAQLNRYYTIDFFTALKKILTPGGVVSLRLPASPNYMGREGTDINSLVYATLKKVFPYVIIVPGEKNYFIASGRQLSLNITRLLKERDIKNKYVSEYYIQDDLLKFRNEQIMARLVPVKHINTDMNPIAYFRQISLWLSYYKFKTKFLFLALGLVFLILLLRAGPVPVGMFAGGFAASSVEILLLFTFQVIYGYVYLMTGVLVTVFMAGITMGAMSERYFRKKPPFQSFIRIELFLAIGSLIPPVLMILLKPFFRIPGLGQLIMVLYTFAFAFLVGRLFFVGTHVKKESISKISSSLYSADLAGGALGALAVSGILLPLAGIWKTALVTSLVCLLAVVYLLSVKKKIMK